MSRKLEIPSEECFAEIYSIKLKGSTWRKKEEQKKKISFWENRWKNWESLKEKQKKLLKLKERKEVNQWNKQKLH